MCGKKNSIAENPPPLVSFAEGKRPEQRVARGIASSRSRQRKALVSVYLKNESPPLKLTNINEHEQVYKYTGYYLSKNSKPRPSKCYMCGVSSSKKVVHFENVYVPCVVNRSKSVCVVMTVCLICFKAINIMALSGHKDLLETQLRSRVSGNYRHPLLFEPIKTREGVIQPNTRCFLDGCKFAKGATTSRIVYNLNDPGSSAKFGIL